MKPDFFYDNHELGTMKLEHYLSKFSSFDEFEKRFPDEMLKDDCRVGDYLNELISKYNMPISVVSAKAGKSFSYLGNIIGGRRRNPSRDSLINFCLVMGTTLDELQCLLKYSGHQSLYVRRKRDVVIWYGIMKKESIDTIEQNLIDRGLRSLFDE